MSCYVFVDTRTRRVVHMSFDACDPGPLRARVERKLVEGKLPKGVDPQNCTRYFFIDGRFAQMHPEHVVAGLAAWPVLPVTL